DRLPHRLPRLRILDRIVGRALRQAEALRSNAGPRAVEDPHRDLEALAFFPEKVRHRDTGVVEYQLTRRRALDPHLGLETRDRESRRVRLDDERGDSRVPCIWIRLGKHRVQLRDARIRDEPLRSIEAVLLAVE